MSRRLPIQIIITSLLLIFVFNNFGYWFCFKVEQAGIKEEMYQRSKDAIPNSQLTSIVITGSNEKELAWTDKNEFKYKGEMYDVVRSEKNSTTTIYYCLTDAKEEALNANLSSHINDNLYGGKTTSKKANDISKLFSQTYFNTTHEFSFYNSAERSVPAVSSIIYTPIKPDILCPPPDRIS